MAQKLQSIKPIRTHTVLADDEIVIGKHTDGSDIIQRTYTKMIAEDVLDKKGDEVWKMNHLGIPISKVRRLVPTEVTEIYVYHEAKTGHNFKNRDFRTSDADIEKERVIAAAATLQQDFFKTAAASGLTAEKIVAGFKGSDTQEAAMELEVQRRVDQVLGTQPAVERTEEEVASGEERQASAQQEIKERKARAAKSRAQKTRRAKKQKTEMAGV